MTRHKQEEHGHPHRGEEAPYKKRVTHSVVILPRRRPDIKGKARSNKRCKPYTDRRKRSTESPEPPSSSSSHGPCALELPPFFATSSTQASAGMPQTYFGAAVQNTDETYIPPAWPRPTDNSGFDAILPSEMQYPENQFGETAELLAFIRSLPEATLPEPAPAPTVDQPIPTINPYTSSSSKEVRLPDGAGYPGVLVDPWRIHTAGDRMSTAQPHASPVCPPYLSPSSREVPLPDATGYSGNLVDLAGDRISTAQPHASPVYQPYISPSTREVVLPEYSESQVDYCAGSYETRDFVSPALLGGTSSLSDWDLLLSTENGFLSTNQESPESLAPAPAISNDVQTAWYIVNGNFVLAGDLLQTFPDIGVHKVSGPFYF